MYVCVLGVKMNEDEKQNVMTKNLDLGGISKTLDIKIVS